jgi:uncharacterized protein (TIGR02679 family)
MNEQREKEVKRFFSEPGLARFIDLLRKKYRSRGASGTISLPKLSAEESAALTGLLGIYLHPGKDLSVKVKHVEKILLHSSYAITIRELLACLDGGEVLTRTEEEQQAQIRWKRFFDEALQAILPYHPPPDLTKWVEQLRQGIAPGSRILRRMHAQNPEEALRDFVHCLAALCRVWKRESEKSNEAADRVMLRLPVLAAQVTGDAHGFDYKKTVGRLLWHGILAIFTDAGETAQSLSLQEWDDDWEQHDSPGDDEKGVTEQVKSLLIRETYRLAGIADDDISSQVILFAPYMTGKCEELVLTLRQVEKMPVVPACSELYVVENPSVFATLLEGIAPDDLSRHSVAKSPPLANAPMLVCLNGQPSAATIRWLDRCMEGGEHHNRLLYYSGDFDVKGVAIAQALHHRYGQRFVPWRMSAADYEKYADAGIPLSGEEKRKLQKWQVSWDGRLGTVMAQHGTKVHQELFVEDLLLDWLNAWGEV